jgi:hypothetical protein
MTDNWNQRQSAASTKDAVERSLAPSALSATL